MQNLHSENSLGRVYCFCTFAKHLKRFDVIKRGGKPCILKKINFEKIYGHFPLTDWPNSGPLFFSHAKGMAPEMTLTLLLRLNVNIYCNVFTDIYIYFGYCITFQCSTIIRSKFHCHNALV